MLGTFCKHMSSWLISKAVPMGIFSQKYIRYTGIFWYERVYFGRISKQPKQKSV
jgi:hypothetical protein